MNTPMLDPGSLARDQDFALLDLDAWDAPERLTEDDCRAVTGADAWREHRLEGDGR